MSALQIIAAATEAGIRLEAEGDKLIAECGNEITAALVTDLKRHKAEIIALLRQAACAVRPAGYFDAEGLAAVAEVTGRSSGQHETELKYADAPWPEPAIVKDPYFAFGADQVPHRYRRAWRELLARCPSGAGEWQWAQAIYDARDLFGTWGAKLEEMRWADDDIFERPDGLIWFLQGEYVTFPGGMTAHTSGKRIWRRQRR